MQRPTRRPDNIPDSVKYLVTGAAGYIGSHTVRELLARDATRVVAVDSLVRGHQGAIDALAGVAGAVVDTIVGAWWQARRWCPSCERETEQARHRCGAATVPYRGVSWLGNDAVNLICTVAGAAVMGAILRIGGS